METREENVTMVVMVPLIISNDEAVHKDTVRRWKDFDPDSLSTECRLHRTCSVTMWQSLECFQRGQKGVGGVEKWVE